MAHPELERALAERDPDYVDDDGTRALHLAAHRSDLEAVRALLAAGVDPEVRMRNSTRPMDLTTDSVVAETLRAAGARGEPTDLRSAAWARFGVPVHDELAARMGTEEGPVRWLPGSEWFRDEARRVVIAVHEDGRRWAIDVDGHVWEAGPEGAGCVGDDVVAWLLGA